jgi:hypothetical protein
MARLRAKSAAECTRGIGVEDLAGKVAVVTGGAAGIGRGIVEALLEERARVVIADIEAPVLEATVAELSALGEVGGVVTDVSDPTSVEALADLVFDRYQACHLLWNNAGVTSGGGGNPWDQEPNDWRWCFGVNVFGTANGVLSFVPRMIASDLNRGSSSPPRRATVASRRFLTPRSTPPPRRPSAASPRRSPTSSSPRRPSSTRMRSSTRRAACSRPGLWEAQRNRPPESLARPAAQPAGAGHHLRRVQGATLAAAGRPTDTVDLTELGRFAVNGA